MSKVFFLVNQAADFACRPLISKYLPGSQVTVGDVFPADAAGYDLIVLWSYRRILPGCGDRRNVILFHSSDLPAGKGWAPIYHAVSQRQPFYTISGIFAADAVDSGDVIVKARFALRDDYTAEIIRRWDDEISILLVGEILRRYPAGSIKGAPQTGRETYNPRRRGDDNRVDLDARLGDIVDHLRACEKHHPAFFIYNGCKYNIYVEPAERPDFPADLEIKFFGRARRPERGWTP